LSIGSDLNVLSHGGVQEPGVFPPSEIHLARWGSDRDAKQRQGPKIAEVDVGKNGNASRKNSRSRNLRNLEQGGGGCQRRKSKGGVNGRTSRGALKKGKKRGFSKKSSVTGTLGREVNKGRKTNGGRHTRD